jgi:hypothetical protein
MDLILSEIHMSDLSSFMQIVLVPSSPGIVYISYALQSFRQFTLMLKHRSEILRLGSTCIGLDVLEPIFYWSDFMSENNNEDEMLAFWKKVSTENPGLLDQIEFSGPLSDLNKLKRNNPQIEINDVQTTRAPVVAIQEWIGDKKTDGLIKHNPL